MLIPRLNWKNCKPRSYGGFAPGVKIGRRVVAVTLAGVLASLLAGPAALASDRAARIVALGDSLTAGYGLAADEAFPVRLQRALAAKGIAAEIANAGVSGDTASGGLARLDWSVPDGTDAVILELGANDSLRGVDPKVTRGALEAMLRRLRERHIAVLLCGMLAPRNMGADYAAAFDGIYPDLAREYGAILYPFFLEGVATEPKLNQRDGLHPTGAGVDMIVAKILPAVERLVAQVKDQVKDRAKDQAKTNAGAGKSP
jgi:acyl-CoA thioesterase I